MAGLEETSISESDSNSSSDESICISFGDESEYFNKHELVRFFYFRTVVSERWSKHKNNNESADPTAVRKINLFGSSGQSAENEENGENGENGETQLFGVKDLRLLLECSSLGHIPYDLKFKLKSLESLIRCSDFLTCQEDAEACVISEECLVDYLKKCHKQMSLKKLERLIEKTQSEKLKRAIDMYVCELKKMITNQMSVMYGKHDKVRLKGLRLDAKSSTILFIEKFKLVFSAQDGRLNIRLLDFTRKDDYMNLWDGGSRGTAKHANVYEMISKSSVVPLISKIISCDGRFHTDRKEYAALQAVLGRVEFYLIDLMRCGDGEHLNLTLVDLLDVMKAQIKLCYMFRSRGKSYENIHDSFKDAYSWLNSRDRTLFTKFIIDNHGKYTANYVQENSSAPQLTQIRLNGLKHWFKFLKYCIVGCDKNTIMETIDLWFPILHENHPRSSIIDADTHIEQVKENDAWVIEKVVPKFDNFGAFKFALYLSNYLVFDRIETEPNQMSQAYLSLIKKHLGVSWKFLPD